mgnify:CR=1 FL=1
MKGTSPSRVIRAVAGYGIQVPRWEVRSLINSLVVWKGKAMTAIVTIGIDLAKYSLQFMVWMSQASPLARWPTSSRASDLALEM